MRRLVHSHRQHARKHTSSGRGSRTHMRSDTYAQERMHACRGTHVCPFAQVRAHLHACSHRCVHTHTFVCIGLHTRASTHRPAHTHICTRKRTHAGMHAQALTHAQMHSTCLRTGMCPHNCWHTHTHACIGARMCRCTRTFVYPRMRRQHASTNAQERTHIPAVTHARVGAFTYTQGTHSCRHANARAHMLAMAGTYAQTLEQLRTCKQTRMLISSGNTHMQAHQDVRKLVQEQTLAQARKCAHTHTLVWASTHICVGKTHVQAHTHLRAGAHTHIHWYAHLRRSHALTYAQATHTCQRERTRRQARTHAPKFAKAHTLDRIGAHACRLGRTHTYVLCSLLLNSFFPLPSIIITYSHIASAFLHFDDLFNFFLITSSLSHNCYFFM